VRLDLEPVVATRSGGSFLGAEAPSAKVTEPPATAASTEKVTA
jgi:hypothetical protein